MLSTEQAHTILLEEALGKPPTISGPEADDYRQRVRAEIGQLRAKGMEPDLPHEIDCDWGDEE